MREKLYSLIRDFLFHAPVVSDMNLAEYLITNGVTIPVRCKDCKWMVEFSGKDSGKPCGYGYCKNPIGLMGIAYNESYCSYGERKDND